MGIKMMGEGGGEWWTFFMTAIFCYCIDRDFARGAILCAICTGLQGLTGIPTLYNRSSATGKMGPEMAGLYPKIDDDTKGRRADQASAMCTGSSPKSSATFR